MRQLLITAMLTMLLTGCGLRYVMLTTDLPMPDMVSLNGYTEPGKPIAGYAHICGPAHDEHCFYVEPAPGQVDWRVPLMVEHVAYFFNTMRYSEWCSGPLCRHRSWSWVWMPFGLPELGATLPDSERPCGLQLYSMLKVEGTIGDEMMRAGYAGRPIEFKPSEQRTLRIKCNLATEPSWDNMAGY